MIESNNFTSKLTYGKTSSETQNASTLSMDAFPRLVFGCHDAKWAKVLLKKLIFTKKKDFPRIRHKNVQVSIWCDSPFRIFFFLALFLSFFSAFWRSRPFALHILSGCRIKLGVDYGQSLEIAPWSIIGQVGHFTTTFAPKLITLFFSLLRYNAVDIQSRPLCV